MQGELKLPEEEMDLLLRCSFCPDEKLEVLSAALLEKMRAPGGQTESQILCCKKCKSKCTVTSKVEAVLEKGYNRLRRKKPSDTGIDNLLWRTLKKRPLPTNKEELDLWMLDFACIQMRVNFHDWRHRKSCFKSGRKACRYGIPPIPSNATAVNPIYLKEPSKTESTHSEPQKIVELQIDVKKRAPFIFFTDCNSAIMSVMHCNNCTRCVKNQKVSLYYGAYTTKHNTDCEQALAEAIIAIQKHGEKVLRQQEKADQQAEANERAREEDPNFAIANEPLRRTDFSIGLGKLLSGVRASTNGETIGGPLAAFVLRGNLIFEMSYKTAALPLSQAIAYLPNENIFATINRFGEVKATTHDYVFRSDQNDEIERMSFWNFFKTQEICKLSSKDQDIECDDFTEDPKPTKGRFIHNFVPGHPQQKTQGHRARTTIHWLRYLAARLPDLNDLKDDSYLDTEEREKRRTEYAKGVLTMFIPFRDISDLIMEGETWWEAYTRQKYYILSDKTARQVINSLQNFYESFCTSSPETELLGFTEQDLQDLVEEENEVIQDAAVDIIDMTEIEALDEEEENKLLPDDPFISRLATLTENPLDLSLRDWPSIISYQNAKTAVDSLPKGI